MLSYKPGSMKIQVVDKEPRSREFISKLVGENLQHAQERMKIYTNKK